MTTNKLSACLCGCGRQVKGHYALGHDAKHVSRLVDAVLTQQLTESAARDELAHSYGLQNKLGRAIKSRTVKLEAAQKRAARKSAAAEPAEPAAPKTLLGRAVEVKIGRWVYPGKVSAVTDRDEVEAVTITKRNGDSETIQVIGDSGIKLGLVL